MSKKPPPQPIFTFRGEMKYVYCIYFRNSDSHSYAYCGVEGEVQIWDVKVYRLADRLKTGSSAIVQVGESKETLVTQERGGIVRGWKPSKTISAPFVCWSPSWCINTGCVTLCRIVSSSWGIWCPTENNSISRYVEGESKEKPWSPPPKAGLVMALGTVEGGGVLVACESGLVSVLSLAQETTASTDLNLPPGDVPTALDCISTTAIVGSSSNTVMKLSISAQSVEVAGQIELSSPGVSAVSLRCDAALVAVATWQKSIKVLSVKNLRLLAILQQPSTIECVAWTDHDGLLYCGDKEGRVSMYSLYPPAKENKKSEAATTVKKDSDYNPPIGEQNDQTGQSQIKESEGNGGLPNPKVTPTEKFDEGQDAQQNQDVEVENEKFKDLPCLEDALCLTQDELDKLTAALEQCTTAIPSDDLNPSESTSEEVFLLNDLDDITEELQNLDLAYT